MTDEFQGRPMQIGNVFNRSFGVMTSNPLAVFGSVLILLVVPQLIFLSSLQTQMTQQPPSTMFSVIGLYGLIMLTLTCVAQAAITRATVAFADGRKAGFGECLGVALRAFVPLVGLGLLTVIGIYIGMILLIVPGIILALMWAVAGPALVAERIGVIEALGRSRALTKGSRWKILGMYVAAIVLLAILSMMLGVIGGTAIGAMLGLGAGMASIIVSLFISALSSTLTSGMFVTLQSALYIELREAKEGPVAEELAAIFG